MTPEQRAKAVAAGQYFTPAPVAREAAGELMRALRGMPAPRIVEPCAGHGALIDALLAIAPDAEIDAVERDASAARRLVRKYGGGRRRPRVLVERADFLTRPRPFAPYDGALMNPPQHVSRPGWDGQFIAQAMAQARAVTAVVRLAALTGEERHRLIWQHIGTRWALYSLVFLVSRPSFPLVEEATGSPRHDWTIATIVRTDEAVPTLSVVRWADLSP